MINKEVSMDLIPGDATHFHPSQFPEEDEQSGSY